MNSQPRSSPPSSNLTNQYDSDECYHRLSTVSNSGLTGYDAVYAVRQWWLAGLSYGTARATIITRLMRGPNTAFLLAQQPNNLCLAYTGCNRRKGPDFGRVFLMLNYTEKPQNTYIQS